MVQQAKMSWRASGQRISLGTVCFLLAIALYAGYEFGFSRGQTQSDSEPTAMTAAQQSLESLQNLNDELAQKLAAADRNAQIQLEAKKHLVEYLKLQQKNNAQLTRDMAIYHNVSGQLPKRQNLQINGFQVFATNKASTFRYLILLSKQQASTEFVQGSLNMTVFGRIGKKLIFLPVRYENSVHVDGLSFKLRDYQEFSGELTFPAGFIPEQVSFKIASENGKLSTQQEFPWKLSS